MARIIIASASNGRQLEVEQAQFDEGFFPGWFYVADAPLAATTEPSAEETRVAGMVGGSGPLPVALRAALVSPLPTVGSLTYNSDGTPATDQDGNSYTWNTDGTPATQTKGGVTRTFHWNTDGTLASVS